MILNVWKNMFEQGYQIASEASHIAGEMPLNPLLTHIPKAELDGFSDNSFSDDEGDKLKEIITQDTNNSPTNNIENKLIRFGNQAIALLSEDGKISNFSENLEDLIEHEVADNQDFISFFHPQHAQAFRNKLFMVINDFIDGESCNMRYQLRDSENEYRWFEICLSKDDELAQKTCVLLLQNVEKQIETERKLRVTQIETELTQKGRNEFLGHMSHELRTPLNAMLGFAEMMERGIYGKVESPEYQEYLSNIRDSGNLLLHRINDMIEVVTSDVSDNVLDESNIQLDHLIDSAIKLHRYEAFCRNITIRHTQNLPRIVIKGEFAKLTRAIGNILSNAIRFSKPNQQITLCCDYTPDEGLNIIIYDDGQGMTKQHIDKITQSLEKPDCLFTQNPESVGVGLGLAVVKEFITLHDGKLNIISYKDRGTEVSIYLPAKRITSLEKPVSRRKKRAAVMAN